MLLLRGTYDFDFAPLFFANLVCALARFGTLDVHVP
ncbi:hypothetical protein GGP57_003047 [Salinibacter ruber]|uniref:Uncharacterized protein n=1 Tax=Salinibacter ruber TaxID=146919 RepID=A0A9X2T904_9BACT|nr:hypothetical protein [Salinibacter ruber]MCS4122352.1 hypothetical protein [Salinibacter ruber]